MLVKITELTGPEVDEFMHNNFPNQDLSSVNSGYEEDQGTFEYLDFNRIIGEMH